MTDFRVITHGPELRVVHVSSGAELGLRRAQSQIEVVEDEDPCRLPISHARSVVAHVLMTLVPRFRAACEAMIQAGALVPRGAATLPYLRLFTELEPQLSLWENGAPPPIVSAQRCLLYTSPSPRDS